MQADDRLSGATIAVAGMAIVAVTRTFPSNPNQVIGPGLFPALIGGILTVLGLTIAIAACRSPVRGWMTAQPWMRSPRMVTNAMLVVAVLIFYTAFVQQLGFFVVGTVFLSVLWLAFGVPRLWIAPLAVGVVAALHFAFYTLLRVPLPWGWLEGLAW